jgi:peptidoglycan/xylan/chitin deacetylase (PgdA/CDA1 family)
MTLLHTPQFSGWARGHLLCRTDSVRDRVALTFDDGPNRSATPRVLDLLARHGAHGTFFTLAPNVDRSPEIVRRMVAEGHEVALHGDLHWPLFMVTPGLLRREVERSAESVARAAGIGARHYRPPFGFMVPSQARFVAGLGFRSVLGDVYPEDSHRPGVERIVGRVLARLAGGSILILHDGSPFGDVDRGQTVAALAEILGHMDRNGLRGVSVAELLDAAPGEARLADVGLDIGTRMKGGGS